MLGFANRVIYIVESLARSKGMLMSRRAPSVNSLFRFFALWTCFLAALNADAAKRAEVLNRGESRREKAKALEGRPEAIRQAVHVACGRSDLCGLALRRRFRDRWS